MTTNLPPPGPYKIPSKSTRQQSRRRRQEGSGSYHHQLEPKRIYASPRISRDDAELFPQMEALQNSAERWKSISEQAGQHRQDGSVLTLSPYLTPLSLKAGITPQVASRVKHLNLWLDPNEDLLPEWLDVVSGLFINIEHLTLADDDHLIVEEEETTVSARMRRLYVLYRLPDLKSIDDMAVTRVERKMARPKTPEGDKVKRTDWVSKTNDMALLDKDKDKDGGGTTKEDASTQGTDTDDSTTSSSSEFISKSHVLHPPPSTPRDIGVEISKSLLDSVMTNDLIASNEDDKYTISIATSDSIIVGGGEQREDSSSNSATNNDNHRDRDSNSNSNSNSSDEKESQNRIKGGAAAASLADALEVDLDGAVQSGGGGEVEDETPIMRLRRTASHCSASGEEKKTGTGSGSSSLTPTPTPPRSLTTSKDTNNNTTTLEIISVASSHHEFTLACGALTFGSRACNPGRMICGAGGGGSSSSKSKEDQRNETKRTLRLNREKQQISKVSTTPSSSRQLPLASPHFATEVVRDGSFGAVKFFPSEGEESEREPHHHKLPVSPRHDISPRQGSCYPGLSPRNDNVPPLSENNNTDSLNNKKLPPSKSLTSPFPMQFRERPPKLSVLHVATEHFDEENQPTLEAPKGGCCNVMTSSTAMETIMSPIPLSRINSSPSKLSSPTTTTTKAASRGELPPQCPGARRRLVVSTAMTPLRSRKAKRILKKIKQSKLNARSTSVFDMEEDDDESDEEELEEEEENIFDFEGQSEQLTSV